MLKKRIIPCLDIAGGKVVKGVNFIDLVDVGDPVEIAKRYEQQCADEVVFLDITATYEHHDIICDLLQKASSKLSIPLTIGGGIGSVDDFRKVLSCGADKVAINSSAVANPNLIRDAAAEFGKQCVVVAIDGKLLDGKYKVFVKGGRENTGIDLVEWAKTCQALGAGEILLTSMDRDGTQDGYDIAMTHAVCDSVNIPVIASGGCGSIDDIINVFKKTSCDAALVASLFHYAMATVNDVKIQMKGSGIPCRTLQN
jgi:cyclase